MAFNQRLPKLFSRLAVLLFVTLIFIAAPSTFAQFTDLRVTIGDTTALPNEQNTVISIFMDNFVDEIAGFNLWIQLDRPDLIRFQTDSQTVIDTIYWKCLEWDGANCIDSIKSNPQDYDFTTVDTSVAAVGNHDVTGTMIENWEYVDSRSLSGTGFDINIAAFCNMPSPPTTPPISPQQGGLLVKVLADVMDVDTAEVNRTVNLMIQYDILDHFNFSRPDGSSIGILYQQFIDTSCYVCSQWVGPECFGWTKLSIPPGGDYNNCDSLEIRADSSAYLNTNKVVLVNGSLTVELPPQCRCGDVNGDDYHLTDISDLTFLVNYLFGGGVEPPNFCCADVNGSGGTLIDISDLTFIVSYLFGGGPEPVCSCN